jgi:hypothetical protein
MTTNEIPHESILFVFIQKKSILIECKDKMQALQHEWKLTHKRNIREKKNIDKFYISRVCFKRGHEIWADG